jgi:hypothetical protein
LHLSYPVLVAHRMRDGASCRRSKDVEPVVHAIDSGLR